MGKPDTSKVGSDRTYQDPHDAVEAEGGKYRDEVAEKTPEEKMLVTPKGEDKQPFANLRKVSG